MSTALPTRWRHGQRTAFTHLASACVVLVLFGALGTRLAQADEAPLRPVGIESNVPDEVLLRPHGRTRLGDGPLRAVRYQAWKQRVLRRHAVSFAVGVAPLVQVAVGERGETGNAIVDFGAVWQPFKTSCTTGSLHVVAFKYWTLGDDSTTDFSGQLGLSMLSNNRDTGDAASFGGLPVLYWQQNFSNFGVRLGQLDANNIWASNRFLDDDNRGFVAQPLVSPRGALFTEAQVGIGAQASAWLDRFYVAAGLQDATGNQETPDFDSLSDGRYFYFVEAGYEPHRGSEQTGSYRATFSYADSLDDGANAGSGNSLLLSATQRLGRSWWAFGRFTHSWGRVPPRYETALVGGVQCEGLGCFSGDAIGLGAFWVHPPALRGGDDDIGMEAFWRLQLTQRLSATPSAQLYASRNDGSGPGAVIALRFRLDF